MAINHLSEARIRVDTIEQTETQLALGQLGSTSDLHSELARLAQAAGRHLWVLSGERVL